MTCDDYQIAFDQQRAGVDSAISGDELRAHVATCAACTAYVSLSEKVSQAMTSTLSQSPAPLELDMLLTRLAAARRNLGRSIVLLPVLVGVVMFGYFVAIRGFTPRGVIASLIGVAVGAVAGYGVMRLWFRRRLAELASLEHGSGEALLIGWRAELDRRIRTERQTWWVLPLVLAAFHFAVVGAHAPSLPVLALEILYLAVPLPLSIVRYRRLARERALLGT